MKKIEQMFSEKEREKKSKNLFNSFPSNCLLISLSLSLSWGFLILLFLPFLLEFSRLRSFIYTWNNNKGTKDDDEEEEEKNAFYHMPYMRCVHLF